MIAIAESTSTRKAIDLTVVPSAAGITVSGPVRWFNEQFVIPATFVPCVFTHPQSYVVALARSQGGAALALVDEDGLPSGYEEICAPIRFRLASPDDTCETVKIEVVRRRLVPELDADGQPIDLPEPTFVQVAPDAVIPVPSIERQIERINAQTTARIESGFEFRGQRFSLSERSQITISNAYTIRDSLPYPLDWANADDTGFVTLTSAADMAAMHKAMALAVLQARGAGNAAKKAAI